VTYVRLGGEAFLSPDQPLHTGPVTSLDLAPVNDGVLVVSGGADGKVWTWMHGRPPMPEPVDARDHPVTAVAAASTPKGLLIASAWADGLVRLRRWGTTATMVDLRLGLPPGDLAIDPTGRICLAHPEGVLCLTLE
jgi:WD40 repeat protein